MKPMVGHYKSDEVVIITSSNVNGNPYSSNPEESKETTERSGAGNSSAKSSTSMGPPWTYPCQEPGCVKQYSQCQDVLGHYNSKHRSVQIPIVVYQWKQ